MTDTVDEVLERLATLDRERQALLERLLRAGFRARNLVGEYGELLAAALYGVERAGPSEPGYDLKAPGVGKVQVKTLRDAPTYRRTSMGAMREPYDTLFAVRLSTEYRPVAAIEVPRATLEELYPHGTRTSWTAKLERQPSVKRIAQDALHAAAAAVNAQIRRHPDEASDLHLVPWTGELALRAARVEPEVPRADQIAQLEAARDQGSLGDEALRALIADGWVELEALLGSPSSEAES